MVLDSTFKNAHNNNEKKKGRIYMSFIKVAQTSDLTSGNKKKIVVADKEILLVNLGDTYYAINNKCPHMGGSLSEGNLEGDIIVCPRHGAAFNVITGKNVHDAKIVFVKMKVNDTQSLPVKVEGTDILVGIE